MAIMDYMETLDQVYEFVDKVRRFILSCLTADERKLYEKEDVKRKNKKYKYHPDLFLPKGCVLLGLPENSVIEIKYNVRFDSLQIAYSDFRRTYLNPNRKNKCVLVFIYHNNPGVLFPQKADENLKVITAEELFKIQPQKYQEINFRENKTKLSDKLIKCKGYKEAFNEGNITLFIGAGVSIFSGLPSWENLLSKIANNIFREQLFGEEGKKAFEKVFKSTLVEARYLKTHLQHQLKEQSDDIENVELREKCEYEYMLNVQRALYSSSYNTDNKLIESIVNIACCRSKVNSIITYNFDDLLENAISKRDVKIQSIYNKNRRIQRKRLPILHVHGIIPQYEKLNGIEMVLSEDAYHNLYNQPYSWANVEQVHALQSSTCFFIGMSMNDPNLRRLLEVTKTSDNATHYAFLPRRDYFNVSYPYPKEEIVDKMFLDLGVQVIWFNNYNDLPVILNDLMDNK